MNYIQQINAFWDKLENDQNLKPASIVVYAALLQINNKTGWKEKFRATFGQVLNMTGISKNTYYSALSELVKGNYLEYEPGPNQYQSATFKMIMLYQILVQHEDSIISAPVQHEDCIENIPKPLNDKKIKTKKTVFVPPTLNEVEIFFIEKGFSVEAAAKAWEYYELANWRDRSGHQVLNWKQKMLAVWLKNENSPSNFKNLNNNNNSPTQGRAASLIEQIEVLSQEFLNEEKLNIIKGLVSMSRRVRGPLPGYRTYVMLDILLKRQIIN